MSCGNRKEPYFSTTQGGQFSVTGGGQFCVTVTNLDYDSIKPDLIIMRLVRRIGVVEKESGDDTLIHAVMQLQRFAFKNGVRPLALDWYMLSFGGQLEAGQGLEQRY